MTTMVAGEIMPKIERKKTVIDIIKENKMVVLAFVGFLFLIIIVGVASSGTSPPPMQSYRPYPNYPPRFYR